MERIYLDYAATTPIDIEVEKAMQPYLKGFSINKRSFTNAKFGNPNSLHYFGQQARKAVDESREKIAKILSCDFREIIFTGSATEANNLAIRGIAKGIMNNELRKKNNEKSIIHNSRFKIPRIIVSAIEHESILETCKDLERDGIEVIYLPVDKKGIVNLKKLKESLNENTILVSIMHANNETGVVQPIAEIVNIINNFRNSNPKTLNSKQSQNSKNKIQNGSNLEFRILDFATMYPLLHIDAVQAFQFLNCNVEELGIDLMTLSAHKIYGPKGTGLLYIRNSNPKTLNSKQSQNSKNKIQNGSNLEFRILDLPAVSPLVTGGGQEFGLRSGTENVPAIVGFVKAIELADKNREKEGKRVSELSNYFWQELKKIYPQARINGINNSKFKIPNIVNIYFKGQSAEELLIKLDLNGVAVSRGSACVSFSAKKSHVLEAMGFPEERIKSSLRFSFGKFTTKAEIIQTLKILKEVLKK